ncbi:hypothetical protein ABT090_39460, partial [Streptomyces asoensis]|uniref:hypothetical protein n=1 Tax=Streptomyces asoensis TaxID=249586 RepID=UPI0033179317
SPAYWPAATLREFAAVVWLDRLPTVGLSLLLAMPVAMAVFDHEAPTADLVLDGHQSIICELHRV